MLDVQIFNFSYLETKVLNNISFQLKKGDHLAILGESGCGKSTLLHIIYGLLHLESGSISWEGKTLLGPQHNLIPGEDNFKLLAQEFNVMPYISVAENIASHLNRMDGAKDAARVDELLDVVDLVAFKNTLVKNLSGGQKQRVALAKALANKPELLLLDEPFSHIDTFRKNKLRRNLFSFLKKENISCITATHDAEEALAYSDVLLILKDGTIEKIGPPDAVFASLQTAYQAGFFGEVTNLPESLFRETTSQDKVAFLPHQLVVSEEKTKLQVVIQSYYFKGNSYLVHATWQAVDVFFEHPNAYHKIGSLLYLKTHDSFILH